MRFTNKVALVTGGASGIGHACVEAFSAEGAAIVIADIDETQGVALANALPQATFVRTDVTVMEDARRAVQIALEAYGGLDILFSNAGIQTYSLVEDMTEEYLRAHTGRELQGSCLDVQVRRPCYAPSRGRCDRLHFVRPGTGKPNYGRDLCGQQGRYAGTDQGPVDGSCT